MRQLHPFHHHASDDADRLRYGLTMAEGSIIVFVPNRPGKELAAWHIAYRDKPNMHQLLGIRQSICKEMWWGNRP